MGDDEKEMMWSREGSLRPHPLLHVGYDENVVLIQNVNGRCFNCHLPIGHI